MSEEEEKAFAGAENRSIAFPLLKETYLEFLERRKENGWEEEEGLQIVFAHGLAYLRNEREFSRWEHQNCDEEVTRLAKYANQMSAQYSVMKFRAFNCFQAKQTLEFNVTGLRGLYAHATASIDRLRSENEQLKAELAKKSSS